MVETKDAKTSEVYTLLKEKIVSMQYLPGQILMVQHLSDEYGFSRTPIREALVRLRDEGLLEASDGRKFRVNQITWKLISDIYDARRAIELMAVRNVAENHTQEQIDELKKIMDTMQAGADSQNYNLYFESDMDFHNKIIEFSGNTVLISWMSRINDQQQRIRYLTSGIHSRLEQSLGEHHHIIEKLEQQDGKGASEMMDQHLTCARADILELRRNQVLYGIRD